MNHPFIGCLAITAQNSHQDLFSESLGQSGQIFVIDDLEAARTESSPEVCYICNQAEVMHDQDSENGAEENIHVKVNDEDEEFLKLFD